MEQNAYLQGLKAIGGNHAYQFHAHNLNMWWGTTALQLSRQCVLDLVSEESIQEGNKVETDC